MNSYFASVEQQANPFLRGQPVGVCAYLHETGCVIAASIEAKKLGMKVGMTVKEARKLVPWARFVQNDPAKYRNVTSKIFSILHGLSDVVEHYSIDEAFLDLTGWFRDEAEAAFVMSRVKSRIRQEIGDWLTCSVGIAPTRFLAKFASDRQKPDGLVIISPRNLDDLLAASDLEDLCGIGPRMRPRLARLGIRTPLELKRHPVGNLMRAFGKAGFFWWCRLHAVECERLADPAELPKSIGHSYCVPNRVNRDGQIEAVLAKLTERAGRRLRSLGLLSRSMSVSVGTASSGYAEGAAYFDEPIGDAFALLRAVGSLLKRIWNGSPVNFLAVTLHDLSLATARARLPLLAGLFDSRESAVCGALDAIRNRYGEEAVVLGRMSKIVGGDEAPERIGFRKL